MPSMHKIAPKQSNPFHLNSIPDLKFCFVLYQRFHVCYNTHVNICCCCCSTFLFSASFSLSLWPTRCRWLACLLACSTYTLFSVSTCKRNISNESINTSSGDIKRTCVFFSSFVMCDSLEYSDMCVYAVQQNSSKASRNAGT